MVEEKRFSTNRTPIEFYIDDDRFFAAGTIPAGTMIDMANIKNDLRSTVNSGNGNKGEESLDKILEIFRAILIDESYHRLVDRVRNPNNPIDVKVLVEVMQWLFGEKYSSHPTQLPSSSLSTSPNDGSGTNSTGGVSQEELIRLMSPGTGSST